MKKLLLLLFSLFSLISFAQLDREHWFAPMYDGQSNGGPEQFLHLSTNETTPFQVYVYSNNVLIYQRLISKGNPGVIDLNRDFIITDTTGDLHKVINKGLYVKADKPCFANLRFGVTNHTEIITSKGTAGIGTDFYAVVAPNLPSSSNLGFSASFLATEDGTTVTVDNFKKTLYFNGIGTRSSFTFTLNKGQSYIIDGRATYTNNSDGFIGAKVTASKPISMSNGNFNGQHATFDSGSGSDILMDQTVPVDKLGDEFVIVKGYGQIGNNMEGAVIVATEANTPIYLNDSPTAVTTLANPGDYYRVPESSFVLRGNNHYNLHIRTASGKKVYVFQLLGGVEFGSAPLATGGMNYIPPLNCYLPRKIDEISYINYLSNVPHSPTFTTKLNIITEKGAAVTVNGNTPALTYGPYDISTIPAEQKWVTYSIPNVTGNITVQSTKAVTAGIASGNAAFGYGGYFAGFSAIPLILKVSGDCLPGVKLAVTEGFDSYQWLIKNPDGTYSTAPGATGTNTYEPPQAGIYAVRIQQGSCSQIQTQDYKFYNCTTYTNNNINSCGINEIITPAFALSSQAVNPATVTIVTAPSKGTVVVNPNGTITYNANPGASGTDQFKFSFCGMGAIPDCETVQTTVHMIEKRDDAVLQQCSTNGVATYDLSTANVSPDGTLTKTYFTTQNGAQNNIAANQILNFTNYTSADGFIYVRLVNSMNCVSVAKVELKSKLAPEVKETLYTKLHCDEDIDGKIDGVYKVDLSTITPIVLVQPSNFVVKYYATSAFATANGTNNLTGIFSFTADTSVWIRVDAPNGCPTTIKEIQLKTGTKFTVATPQSKIVCDNDHNNTENVDLSTMTSLFTTDGAATVKYFATLQAAQNNTPSIVPTQTITGDKTFYYRFTKAGFCDEIGVLNLQFKQGTPTALHDSYTVCQGSTITLNAETTYTSWLWQSGSTTVSTSNTATLGLGVYKVSFTDGDGCIFTKNITIVESPKPIWNLAAFNGALCDSNFDGIINVNLNQVTPVILGNPTLFTVRYYLNPGDAAVGNNNYIQNPATWSYTANTKVYVYAVSQYCTAEVKQIEFKFGTDLPLIDHTVNPTVCDNNIDGTENINLGNYRSLFTADTSVTVRYFATLQNAQNNTGAITAAQTITADKTFYYRFTKAGFCDVIGTLNLVFKAATPTALRDSYTVCAGSTTTLNAETTYTAWLWKKGSTVVSTTNTATLSAGVYTVSFTNSSGCIFTKTITIVDSPKPIWNLTAYNSTLCDENFDGIIPVNLNNVTPIIITNHTLFTVHYYLNPTDANLGNGNFIQNPAGWSYSGNIKIWVRAESQYCPGEVFPIEFKFGTDLSLISNSETTTVCDNDLNGTENINLANYRNLFSTDPAVIASAKYYTTLANAQNGTPTIGANQPITANTTFYYRFKKAGFCDAIGELKVLFKQSTPTALLDTYTVCAGSTITLNAETTYTAWLWKKGSTVVSTTNTATLGVGVYTVSFTNASTCVFTKTITIVESPKPIWKLTNYAGTLCDDDFDGSIPVNLDNITNSIIGNASLFTVRYYLNPGDAAVGNNNYIQNPATWSYTANTKVYVYAVSQYCPADVKQIEFKFGNNIPLLSNNETVTVCDNDRNGTENITLNTYKSRFTNDNAVSLKYYMSQHDAENNIGPVSSAQTVTGDQVFYIRFSKTGFCDVIGKLNVSFQVPRKSDLLVDKPICPGTTTTLDAGGGFDGYLWSTGATSQTVTVPVGDYWVELKTGTCVYKQHVSVTAFDLPVITSVEIQGTTVTVQVSGGNPPYQYAMDNNNYQSSNVFTNVRGGDHTIYVISADNCAPVSTNINVIELYNVITPNGDGVNDILDYSGLMKKEDSFMQIFDRYGKLLFTGNKSNNYIWDGKAFGKELSTGSYWYIMKWREPGTPTVNQYSGWILVKNRE